MRQYPIGTLLAWKTKSRLRRRKFIDNYRHGLKLTDFYIPEDEGVKLLVLDGQQRLQSMFIGLIGSYDNKELYIDILSGEKVAPEDIRYRFKFFHHSEVHLPWIKFKDIVFSNERYNRLAESIKSRFLEELTDHQADTIVDNTLQIIKTFQNDETIVYQEFDSVDNPELYDEDDVVEIFIRANSGGTKLGKSDLLFSLLTSSWEDADANMEDLLENLNRTGFEFTRDFILKSCLSLLRKGAAYNVTKFRDEKTRTDIISNWDAISEAIKDVSDFLYGTTYIRSDKALPSYLGLIPLIYFRYHYNAKWQEAEHLDTYILRDTLSRVV